jgi:hypothetical protein
MLLVILLSLLGLGLLFALRRTLRERQALAAHRDELAAELDFIKKTIAPMYSLISPNAEGGVLKRISEMREITEAIRKHQPELFQQEPGLIHWLSASDQFLCRLCDAAMPKGSNEWCDGERERWERSWELNQLTPRIYEEARAQLETTKTSHPLTSSAA